MRSKDTDTEKKQLKIGLVLILDYNEELQLGHIIKEKLSKVSKERPFFDYNDKNSALLVLNTNST